ncbi:MAG: mechanosensitive ion channel family protein [Campylobacteraceae bacterium]
MKKFLKILLFLCFTCKLLFASNESEFAKLESEYLNQQNIWFTSLKSYRNYESLLSKSRNLEGNIENAARQRNTYYAAKYKEELAVIQSSLKLYEYDKKPPFFEIFSPFETVLSKIEHAQIKFISIFSNEIDRSVKQSYSLLKSYEREYQKAIDFIDTNIQNADKLDVDLEKKQTFISHLNDDKELLALSLDTLKRMYEQIVKQQSFYYESINQYKNAEFKKAMYVFGSIFIVFIIIAIVKLAFYYYKKEQNRTEEDDRKYFTIKRLLNIFFVLITIFIITFSYVENVTKALTIFGVVGAGLTIVMKEWVLSFVGWIMLMFTGSVKLGDRIRIDKDGKKVIGDVINISLTKVTLYENITNDALTEHKRAGRIIFVPNYYLITHEFYNYTHYSLKTILDTVEVNITYDSNLEKAEKIALEVAHSITARYTEMAKKQYDSLKERYTLRNMPQYPKIFFYPHAKGDGVTIGLWYVTPYREILKLKSDMTKEFIKRLNAEEDIHLLYSAETLFVKELPKKVD